MTDLTKILKKGDRLWDSRFGEIAVIETNNSKDYPIIAETSRGKRLSFRKDGRPTVASEITLYPLDQKPAPPQWPEVPKTFEWEGEIYTEGEWVAVRVGDGKFSIHQLQLIIPLEMKHPIKCSNGWVYSGMRKLTSFNQPEEKK